jgi:hypothetical protein
VRTKSATLGKRPKSTGRAAGVTGRRFSRNQFPSCDENRHAIQQAAFRVLPLATKHESVDRLRTSPRVPGAGMDHQPRPTINKRETGSRSLYCSSPESFLPTKTGPEIRDQWAESAYLASRTQTMAILAVWGAVSSFEWGIPPDNRRIPPADACASTAAGRDRTSLGSQHSTHHIPYSTAFGKPKSDNPCAARKNRQIRPCPLIFPAFRLRCIR